MTIGVLAAAMLLAPPSSPEDAAAFERWVQPGSVEAIELLLAAPASRHPASLWGHVMLRVRYRADVPSPPGFAPVFQVGVEDAPKGGEFAHTVKGVFGGLEAKLFVTPSHRVERRYRMVEARGLKVFELELDADERRRVLWRLWEASRDGERWDYAFFTDNCAGLLVELLGPSLAPDVRVRSPRFIRWPSSSLDLLARARRDDGRRIVRYLGEEPGAVDRARDAGSARRAIEARLRERGAPLDGIESSAAPARAAAYATLGEWALASPDAAEDAAAFLSESLDLETGTTARRSRGPLLAALGDALAPLPAPPPRPPVLRRSGVATGASGGYTARIGAGSTTEQEPVVEIDAAILDEALGDVRERGFRPDLGMRLLGARLRVEQGRVSTHEWTFASLDSIRGGHGPAFALRGFGDERRGVTASGFGEFGRTAGVAGDDGAIAVRVAAMGGLADAGVVAAVGGARGRMSARLRVGATSLDRIEAVAEGEAFVDSVGRRADASETGGRPAPERIGWIGRGEVAVARAVGRRDRPSVLRLAVRMTAGPGLGASHETDTIALVEWQLP